MVLIFVNWSAGICVGGWLIGGGVAGNVLVDRPNQIRGQQEQQAAATAEQQRQLDYQRQSQLQQAQVQREIEEQNLYEQWKRERGGVTPAAVNTQADVMTAQRLLTALSYYRGPIDGIYGGGTRSAVMQFEGSQGLPRTGYLTPSLVQTMRAAL